MSRLLVDLRPHDDREMLLLIDCARASVEPERAERIRALAAADLNWERLVKLARRNGLAPLLFTHLSQICAELVPAAVFDSLRDYFQKNSAFGLLLTGELLRLLEILNDHGIMAIPYKGPAVAAKLYGSLAKRQFGDLDILVRKSDVWEASRLIESLGFEPLFLVPMNMRSTMVRQTYVRMFSRDTGRTLVELHWGLAERYWAVQFDAESVRPRLEPMSLLGTTVSMPCAEDLLLMLCVHGGRHSGDKLEGVCSIAELLRQTPDLDWASVWQRSGEMHCRRMLEFGLLLAHGLFDTPLPQQAITVGRSRALLAMAREVVQSFAADDPPARTWPRQIAFHLRLEDNYSDQMRHCMMLLTSTPDDWAMFRLPPSLSFAYPVVRAIRLARKHGQAEH